MKSNTKVLALITGTGLFAAVSGLTAILLNDAMRQSYPWLSQVVLKALLVLASVCAALVFKIPVKHLFTFRNSDAQKVTGRLFTLALLTGAITTAVILLLHLPPMPHIKDLSFLQLVLVVWIGSSVSEEIFARGFVQTLAAGSDISDGKSISPAIWIGAIVFSFIHFSVFLKGGSIFTTLVIMAGTLLLGLLCGKAREKSGMASAVLVHMGFNVGGFAGTVLLNVGFKLATGNFLTQ